MARVLHEIENRALDDQVVEVERHKIGHDMRGDELGVRVLLRIGGVETVLVLDVDHPARAEHLGDQEAAGVGPLRRNAADDRVLLPQLVGRHSLADHRAADLQIVRQDAEALRLDERNSVSGEQVVQHLRVLPGDRGAEHREDADRQAEIDREAVDVARARAGAGAENHLVLRQVGDDLVDQRIDRRAAPVDDALAADLHHVGPRQDAIVVLAGSCLATQPDR